MKHRLSTREPRPWERAGVPSPREHDGADSGRRSSDGFERLASVPGSSGRTWVRVSVRIACVMGAVLCGCRHQPTAETDTSPPTVVVAQPVSREVTDFVEFIGRTEAPFSLDVRARVTGYLVKMPVPGRRRSQGGRGIVRDRRPAVQGRVGPVAGQLGAGESCAVKAQAFLDIGLETQKLSAGAVSQQEIVQRQGARDEAAAAVNSAQATLENGQLNYDWCKVTSSIDGRVSRYFLTLGNLVTQDSTLLTTVVSEDPLYVYFDIDERHDVADHPTSAAKRSGSDRDQAGPRVDGPVRRRGFPAYGLY